MRRRFRFAFMDALREADDKGDDENIKMCLVYTIACIRIVEEMCTMRERKAGRSHTTNNKEGDEEES